MDEPTSAYHATFVIGPQANISIEHDLGGRIILQCCECADDNASYVDLTHTAGDNRTAAAFLLSLSLHAQHAAALLGFPDAAQFASELKVYGQPMCDTKVTAPDG